MLARVLPADGRSRAYVDGRLATAGELAEIGATLVDLHGQHAHQHLLAPVGAAGHARPVRGRRRRSSPSPRCGRPGARRGRCGPSSTRSAATIGPEPVRSTSCGSRSPRSTTRRSPTRGGRHAAPTRRRSSPTRSRSGKRSPSAYDAGRERRPRRARERGRRARRPSEPRRAARPDQGACRPRWPSSATICGRGRRRGRGPGPARGGAGPASAAEPAPAQVRRVR